MTRRVFFSFHFDRDVWRAGQVRNSNAVTSAYSKSDFLDAAAWEAIKKRGDDAVKSWIDTQLQGTAVTVVLIGAQTAERKFVQYEIRKSLAEKKGLLGIYVHQVKDSNGQSDTQGKNPFVELGIPSIATYDWVANDGRTNIGIWIERAAQQAGR